ncbi:MAG: hypothetical protein DRJ10_09435 [Bacteroidetes bacterium]|nr:MAG: hypothetical protein DRJ10_09435 [Bacteroidota bacterium]
MKDNKKDKPEYIQSSYVYNITKFVTWPVSAFNFSLSPFVLGVFGSKEIGSVLVKALREKKIIGRDWKVEFYTTPEEIRNCHLIFVSHVSTTQVEALINSLKQKHVLTVGNNIPDFCESGGMINIVGTVPNLGFEINKNAFKLSKLEISSELLNMATII